jgi:hypothetical protein
MVLNALKSFVLASHAGISRRRRVALAPALAALLEVLGPSTAARCATGHE